MAEGAWETAHVTFAKADQATGAVTCQIGDVKSGEVYDAECPVFQSWGFLSLPATPLAGVSAAEAVVLKHPAGDVVVGGRSVRSAYIAGLIKQGEGAFFADGSQASVLVKLDGSINLYTTHDNTFNGRNVYYRVAPDRGFDEAWPWGRRFFDKSGHHLVHVSGAQLHLGSVSAPAPLDSFSTYFAVTAKMSRINTSFLTVGADGAVYSPVARADALLTLLQAMQSEIAAISTTVAKIAATSAAPGSAPTANPLVAEALVAQAAAVTAASSALTAAAAGTVPVPGPIGAKSLATA